MKSRNRLLKRESKSGATNEDALKPKAVQALAGVLRSAASAIAAFMPLERQLRVLATVLDENEADEGKGRRGRTAATPRATVEFTELDSKKAERALARIGIRSAK